MDPLFFALVLASIAVGITLADMRHRHYVLKNMREYEAKLECVLRDIQAVNNANAEAFVKIQDQVAAHEMRLAGVKAPSAFGRHVRTEN